MNAENTGVVHKHCQDEGFRQAVYQAGHALSARALGLKLISFKVLPRPPILVSDKTFSGFDWISFIEMLEIRIIELMGGQIAELYVCKSHESFAGDVSRIDELTRLVSGLDDDRDPDEVWFDLEDIAEKIFAQQAYLDAIIPMAEFFYQEVKLGREEIQGSDIEAELDKHVPVASKENWVKRVFSFGGKEKPAAE